MTATVMRDVEVDGRRVDVRLADGRIAAIDERLTPAAGDAVEDGGAGWLLPGLHDHHLHLMAMAAAKRSVDVSGCRDRAELGAVLASAPGTGWIRATGYHESIAGELDRHVLDALVPSRPVRVQHRSGGLWILGSRALGAVATSLDASPDVGRDAAGAPDGRLWRYDTRLRRALPDDGLPPLAYVGTELSELGITSVTDATPDLTDQVVSHLRTARTTGDLPQRVTLLAATAPAGTGLDVGPRKVLLHDHDLPTFDELLDELADARAQGRSVAVHCVTREALLLTLAALDQVGRRPGDRIEHAAVVPVPALLHGLVVVTQPAFVTTRGDAYLRDVHPDDLPHLYPFAGLLRAGIQTWASSDAPFGPLDPWSVLRSARDRCTTSGRLLGSSERATTEQALSGYLSDAFGRPRRVRVGVRADLVLMEGARNEVLSEPAAERVRATWIAGRRTSR